MALIEQLDRYARVGLGHYPTPLDLLPRVGAALGRPVLIKRDDQIGPLLGGNKARKLEYLMGEAQRRGAQRVVTFGGLQSNHARMTAAAARMLGMQPHLFYFARRPRRLSGNLQLAELLGARLHFIPIGGGGGMSIERSTRLVRLIAAAVVGRHYFIPVGGHSWLGCLGYVRGALELDAQARARGLRECVVVCAAGTGGTLAGLMAGLALVGSQIRPIGVDIGGIWAGFRESIARVAGEICGRLGSALRFAPGEVPLVERRYVGRGYAQPTADGLDAVARTAQLEGVLLDPVYTGKAFAGMLDMAARGELGRATPLIFLHTGGAPALFA